MEVIDDAGRKYRGKMGNLIYYTVNGKTYVRRARKRPGRQGKPRTEKQKALSGRFRLVQKVYSFYMQTVSADIWRIAARAQGRRGQNLFCEVNSGCFEAGVGIASPETFRFSEGELLLPWGIQVEALGSGRFPRDVDGRAGAGENGGERPAEGRGVLSEHADGAVLGGGNVRDEGGRLRGVSPGYSIGHRCTCVSVFCTGGRGRLYAIDAFPRGDGQRVTAREGSGKPTEAHAGKGRKVRRDGKKEGEKSAKCGLFLYFWDMK